MNMEQVWIAGVWRSANASASFIAKNPATASDLPGEYPVSTWVDCDAALEAASGAARDLRKADGEQIAAFLDGYARAAESNAEEFIAMANAETGLPITPRLQGIELPRMTTQLRQAAAAAREGSWQQVVIDKKANIRSHFAAIGPVIVFGPNNFPFAFQWCLRRRLRCGDSNRLSRHCESTSSASRNEQASRTMRRDGAAGEQAAGGDSTDAVQRGK